MATGRRPPPFDVLRDEGQQRRLGRAWGGAHRREHRAARIAQLAADDAQVVSGAAETIFHHAHLSHPHSARKNELVREQGGIPALCAVLRSKAWPVRRHTCCALGELAFGNKRNCWAIVSTAGALEALAALFPHDTLSTQELAATVVNNCAAFGEEACLLIVESPGMLEGLKRLGRSGSCRARCVTIGAMNCLSRCEGARDSLLRMDVVGDVLLPALREVPVEPAQDHLREETWVNPQSQGAKCAPSWPSSISQAAVTMSTRTIALRWAPWSRCSTRLWMTAAGLGCVLAARRVLANWMSTL